MLYVLFTPPIGYTFVMGNKISLSSGAWDVQAERYKLGVCCHVISSETGASKQTVISQLRKRGVILKSRKDWGVKVQGYRLKALVSGNKECRSCNVIVPIPLFGKDRKTIDGAKNICKKCFNLKMKVVRADPVWKVRRLANIQRYRSTVKGHSQMLESARRAMGRPGNRFTAGRQAAKKRGLTWLLDRGCYLSLIKLPCRYCGGDLPPFGTGLDRVDNSRGYELTNVVPCCSLCNLTRGDRFTYAEMVDVIGPGVRRVRAVRNIGSSHVRPDYSPVPAKPFVADLGMPP